MIATLITAVLAYVAARLAVRFLHLRQQRAKEMVQAQASLPEVSLTDVPAGLWKNPRLMGPDMLWHEATALVA